MCHNTISPDIANPVVTDAVLIAPKASAEGACILNKMGFCYGLFTMILTLAMGNDDRKY